MSVSKSRLLIAGVALLSASAAVFLRWGHSLSVDEPFTARALTLPWADLTDVLRHDNIPTTYLLLGTWARVAGHSELALRVLFIAAFAVAILLTGDAARRIAGAAAGVFAAMLVGASGNVGMMHAATIRPYALLMLVAALVLWLTLASLSENNVTRRRSMFAVLVGIAHLTGLFTHPIYVFFLLAWMMAVLLLTHAPRRALLLAGTAAPVIYLALWWPMLRATMALPATQWMAPPVTVDLWNAWLGIWGNRTGFMLLGAIVALVAVAGRGTFARIDRVVLFAAICGAATLLLPFAVSFWRPVFHLTRTASVALPAIALAVAMVFNRLAPPRLTVVFTLIVAAAGVQFVFANRSYGDPSPTRQSVQEVLNQTQCGDSLVLGGLSFAAVSYYLDRLGAPACLKVESFPAGVVEHPGWIDDEAAMQDPSGLSEEAAQMAARLQSTRGRVWLFGKVRGVGQPASDAATAALTERLQLEKTLALRGAFFDVVRVYRTRDTR